MAGLSIFNSVLTFYEVPEDKRDQLFLEAIKAGPDNFHLPKGIPLESAADPATE